jgi:hypothetical protein
MNKRHKEALKKLGITTEKYNVCYPGDDLPHTTGLALIRDGHDVMVVEQRPRGWGGDGKFYVYRHRCPRPGRNTLSAPHGTYKTQREAIAAILIHDYRVPA